jgi:hypothetical protein
MLLVQRLNLIMHLNNPIILNKSHSLYISQTSLKLYVLLADNHIFNKCSKSNITYLLCALIQNVHCPKSCIIFDHIMFLLLNVESVWKMSVLGKGLAPSLLAFPCCVTFHSFKSEMSRAHWFRCNFMLLQYNRISYIFFLMFAWRAQ